MRIILTSLGTTGDIFPFIALAAELQHHGHEPVLALSPVFEQLVVRSGLAFAPAGPDIQEAFRNMVATRNALTDFYTSEEAIKDFFAPVASALPQMFADLRSICRDADMIVCGPTQPAGRMLYELTNIPYVSVYIYPPGAGIEPALQQARLAMVNSLRREAGLPTLHDLSTAFTSPQLTLFTISRHVLPRPAAWPAHYHLTGFFYLNEPGFTPDPGLMEFLNAGPPPLVVSFGSMTHGDPAAFEKLLLDAIRQTGCRAIIQSDTCYAQPEPLPESVLYAGFLPHSWLFPRSACVAHHGGAGTTAAAFRAGVPQVIIPHLADQPIWAELCKEAGCAGPAPPYTRLTAGNLAEAIAQTITRPHYRQAARTLGEKIRGEQGVSMARGLIEELAERCGLAERGEPAPGINQQERRKIYQQRRRRKKNY